MNYRHCFLLLPLLFSCSTPEPVIPRELKGIEIVLPPSKTHYVSGETFCPSGMVILGNYNVGGNTPIYGYEAKPHRPLRPSDTSIAISYQGFSASLSIDVTGEDEDYEEEAWHYGSLGEDYLEHLAAQSGGGHYEVGQLDQPALDIHTDEQYAYLRSDYTSIEDYCNGKRERSRPRGIALDFEGVPEAETYYVSVSRKEGGSASVFNVNERAFAFQNAELGKVYTYKISEKEDFAGAQEKEFVPLNLLPRNLYIDGVSNVRDIGGYPSRLGGHIKQGLYYRGGRLNASKTSRFRLDVTEEGLAELRKLGIKTEMDLRMNSIDEPSEPTNAWNSNEFGDMQDGIIEGISYHRFPLNWHQADMMKSSKAMIGEIFHFIAKEENYPIYLHCNIGTDRTGMISYLLGNLLGMYQEDLYRDYLFSGFGDTSGIRSLEDLLKYQNDLLEYGDFNMYWNTRWYLQDCGLSEKELDDIIYRFLDFTAE